jgi:hypothetical protein
MKAALAGVALVLAGCVSVSENLSSLGGVGADSVVLVGKIQIIPPIGQGEQKYKVGLDPFNTQRNVIGRAVLFVSDRPEYQERTQNALNPPLEETFFLKLPKSQRFMVKGAVTMEFAARAVSARQMTVDQSELLFPAPIAFDIRPGDTAVYIGTLRLYRDEFHEVTKAEVRDDYGEASAQFRTKFPGAPLPRKALLKAAKR